MEVIIELSFCINFLIDAFILKSTALFLKQKARLWWMSALIGSVIALIYPLFHLNSALKILLACFTVTLMVGLSFQPKDVKNFIIACASFSVVTFVFGGGCYAFEEAFGALPLLVILGITACIQMVVVAILKIRNKALHIDTFSYKVRLTSGDKVVEEEGFLDSGNMLFDPVTKQKIVLISFDVFSKIYKNADYMNAFLKKIDLSTLRNGHYVKINAIASGTNILVFDIDKVEIARGNNYYTIADVALGLSFSGFERAFGKNILLHSELIGG